MRKLYSFDADYYYGFVGGLFVAEKSDIEEMVGHNIYMGEIQGKHSEVQVEFEMSDFVVFSEDENIINMLIEKAGGNTICGYNPSERYKELKDDGFYDDE